MDNQYGEEVDKEHRYTDTELYLLARERPGSQEVCRGIIRYHNEIVDCGYEIGTDVHQFGDEVAKKTLFFHVIKDLISKASSPIRLLDLGCGSGQFLKELKNFFGDRIESYGITARLYRDDGTIIDINEEEKTIQELASQGINIAIGNMNDLTRYPPEYFDLVVSAQGITYSGDPLGVVEQAGRVMKKEALMIAGPIAAKIIGSYSLFPFSGNELLAEAGITGVQSTDFIGPFTIRQDVFAFKKRGPINNFYYTCCGSMKLRNGVSYRLK